MNRLHLALDIETIPAKSIDQYSDFVQEKITRKIEKIKERNPDYNYDYFASIHGDFGKVICISLAYIDSNDKIILKSILGDDEEKNLWEFKKISDRHRGIFIHYNGIGFDIPFILQRMSYYNLRSENPRLTNLRRFSSDPHFDVMMMYYNWDLQRALPLGVLAELQSLPSPKEDLSGDKVFDAYKNDEWDRIKKYCEFDTATTLNLWRKLYTDDPPVPVENYIFS